MTGAAGQVDLLAWPELRDAQTRLRAADDAVEVARLRVLHAPHGQLSVRRVALSSAIRAALQAGVDLRALQVRLQAEGRA